MNKTLLTKSGVVLALMLSASACGLAESAVESAAEEAIERGLESETDGDVEIDFDFDGDGGLVVETDEGTMTLDSETGELLFEGEDGTVSANEGGVVITENGDDGSETVIASTDLEATEPPDNWNHDVLPIYDGCDVVSTVTTPEGGVLGLSCSDDIDSIVSFYDDAFDGMDIFRQSSGSDTLFFVTIGDSTAQVAVTDEGDTRTLVLVNGLGD